MVNQLTRENFEKVIKENSIVVVEFYSATCKHCKKLEAGIAELSESDAKILLLEKDKRYHKRHLALTGSNRGDRHNRDILINSAFLGVEGTAEYLEELIQKKYGSGEE